MAKFNGMEKYFIQEAIKEAVEKAEWEISNKRTIFGEGYFKMIGNEMLEKVNNLTLKKYQDKNIKTI